ncbi:MAG TPA: pilin, partial [Ramlibacter sp.]|nr:pilin [Ramlibacter sp.]
VLIVVLIMGVLGSIAIREMRDYSRRARVSEVILATNECKNTVGEGYLTRDEPPAPGAWGCESATARTAFVGSVQTSPNGVIRVAVANVDGFLNGHYVYLVPSRSEGFPLATPNDLGNGVRYWSCGSDFALLRKVLPANCRSDTSLQSTEDFG